MSDFNRIDANRIVTDIAVKEGRIADAVALAKRGVQLVLAAATNRKQALDAERFAERFTDTFGSFSTVVDMNDDTVFTTTTYDSFTPISGEEGGRVPMHSTNDPGTVGNCQGHTWDYLTPTKERKARSGPQSGDETIRRR